jgi:hypothetical protein
MSPYSTLTIITSVSEYQSALCYTLRLLCEMNEFQNLLTRINTSRKYFMVSVVSSYWHRIY